MHKRKPILVLDFDGVLHSYRSGWQGAHVVSDPPVEGALEALKTYVDAFQVQILSSRSHQHSGINAMGGWLADLLVKAYGPLKGNMILHSITFPTQKPPAHVTLDDRALTFNGTFPSVEELLAFKPWNKR